MIFSQIMDFASQDIFKVCVKRYDGNYKSKDFSCWKQFLCMVFGLLTHRESITDTLICLKANANKVYHLGMGELVSVSTLTRANENRPYLIYEQLAMLLIAEAKTLYIEDDALDMPL